MTLTALMLGIGALTLLILGLALGLELFCFAAAIALVALLYCAVSVLLARRRLSVALTADREETLRGETVTYTLQASHKPFLPVGPLLVTCDCAAAQETHLILPRVLHGTRETWKTPAWHVGAYPITVREAVLTDCFGILKTHCKIAAAGRLLELFYK